MCILIGLPGRRPYHPLHLLPDLQHRENCLGRSIHAADTLHLPFALLLFFEKLAFAGDVAAVEFRPDVFAQLLDRFAPD
jgi:hypothetical protein